MKQLFLSVALLLCVAGASAEEAKKVPEKKPSIAGFVSNGFWDNWEVSVGAGVNYNVLAGVSGKDDAGSWDKRTGYEVNFGAAKWFHPVFGVRGQFAFGKSANFVSEGASATKWPFIFVHADALINFSNWVGGYRADRVYYAVPFAGFGYQVSSYTNAAHDDGFSTNHGLAFTAGLINKFRVCPALDINLELKGWIYSGRDVPEVLANRTGSTAQTYSATVGVTYRFNNREWQRGVPGYTAEDIQAFQEAVAAGEQALAVAEAENAKLQKDLNEAKAAAVQAKAESDKAKADVVKAKSMGNTVYLSGSSITFFSYGTSRISDREKIRLDLIAEQIKNSPKDKVYTVEGHADAATGTKKGNIRVAENRAKNVYDYLISKGVSPEQLRYEGFGSSKNPYKTNEANRVAIIK